MKKIGILSGQETAFPLAFTDRVNRHAPPGVYAEPVLIGSALQGKPEDYAVIVDRISHDVPFYRSWLKNAALQGAAVINNPFWWSADEKFFNNALAIELGVPVPKTALLPSFALPDDTTAASFRNLRYPWDWDAVFQYTGFPAYMKPYAGGGWKHVYRVENREDFFEKHAQTGQLVMMLQEEIVFDAYYRCYCIGGEFTRIMPYEPRNPHAQRYDAHFQPSPTLLAEMERCLRVLNQALGYDFNTVEFAVRNGVPYAIDFCNPAPDADPDSVGPDHFEWVTDTMARYAIGRAQAQQPGRSNLTWGSWLRTQIQSAAIS
ncbi:ATP-grasp domain-containing protein [Chitinophaga lutea]